VSDRNTTINNDWRTKLRFFLFRKADYIVSNSFSQQLFIETHYPRLTSRVKAITNFVDTQYFGPCQNRECNEELKIIVVARIAKQKNPIFFIDVIKSLVDKGYHVIVDWYGRSIDKDLFNQCLEKIMVYKLEKIFRFKEDSKQINTIYPQYDLFCLPSLREGFPNVVCEAMSCGLPVVCSDVSDIPYIVQDGINGFLFNPNSLTNAIGAMENILKMDISQRQSIGLSNRARIVKMCSKEIFIESYLKILNS